MRAKYRHEAESNVFHSSATKNDFALDATIGQASTAASSCSPRFWRDSSVDSSHFPTVTADVTEDVHRHLPRRELGPSLPWWSKYCELRDEQGDLTASRVDMHTISRRSPAPAREASECTKKRSNGHHHRCRRCHRKVWKTRREQCRVDQPSPYCLGESVKGGFEAGLHGIDILGPMTIEAERCAYPDYFIADDRFWASGWAYQSIEDDAESDCDCPRILVDGDSESPAVTSVPDARFVAADDVLRLALSRSIDTGDRSAALQKPLPSARTRRGSIARRAPFASLPALQPVRCSDAWLPSLEPSPEVSEASDCGDLVEDEKVDKSSLRLSGRLEALRVRMHEEPDLSESKSTAPRHRVPAAFRPREIILRRQDVAASAGREDVPPAVFWDE